MRFSSRRCSRAALSGSTARSASSSASAPSLASLSCNSRRISPPWLPAAKSCPRTSASRYSPVPPTSTGRFPRRRMSCTHASASRTYRATDQLSAGSATATMWWGTPSISSAVGAAVPTVIPR